MEIVSFYDDVEFGEKKPALKVLLKTPFVNEVRIAFQKGQEMKEHKAAHPIVVQVLEGEIDFGVSSDRVLLKKGMAITLEPNILHDLIANEQSIVRLSIHIAVKE